MCVQFAVRKWLWRIVHLKNQAGEHKGEYDETCEKLKQSAKRSVPQFLGKVAGGATVADIYLAEQKVRIFCLPRFVGDQWQIWFSLSSFP